MARKRGKEKENKFIDLGEQFSDAKKYLFGSKNYIYSIVAIFILSAVIGFIFASEFSFIDEILKGILNETYDLNWIEMIFFIMQNNMQVSFMAMLAGIFFGIFPFLNAIANGVVLGYVGSIVSAEVGFLELWRILPHGIFELPAVFISLGFGVRLGVAVFKRRNIGRELYGALNAFLMIIVPLLVIAAVIEGILIFLV